MGCDIHIVLEKKIKFHWVGIDRFMYVDTFHGAEFPACRDRNYERFAQLASVRGEGQKPKGMPADASELSLLLFDESDDHTPSYMSVEEATKIFLETERNVLREFNKEYPEYFYFKVDKESGDNLEDFRIVFWFDN